MKTLHQFRPTYELPSFSTLRTKLNLEAKKELMSILRKRNLRRKWVVLYCLILEGILNNNVMQVLLHILLVVLCFYNLLRCSKRERSLIFFMGLCSKVIDFMGPQDVV